MQQDKGGYQNSQSQNLINEHEIEEIVRPIALDRTIKDINIKYLEDYLRGQSAVIDAEAFVSGPSTVVVEVALRKPVVRFQTQQGSFYCDHDGYIIPMQGKSTFELPIVSGNIQFEVPKDFTGYPASGSQWLGKLIDFSETISNNSYWSREIEQIWIDNNGDVELFTNSCSERFIIGSLNSTSDKLDKMAGYYRTIRPKAAAKGKRYTTVNLKYKDQIICK